MPTTADPSAAAATMPGAVQALIDAAEADGLDLHSVLLVQDGKVLAEAYRAPFDAGTPHRMYSVTKSFTSSAVGLAVAEGRLSVEDPVVGFFPDLAPHPVDDNLAALRVRHLLTMSAEHPMIAGTSAATARPVPSIAGFLGERLTVPPGSRFDYSNSCSYMLAAIVERVTGKGLADYLRPRLFEPLGIAADHWLRSPEGVTNGGWGLHLTTRELAELGRLLLGRGVHQGRRILPEAWVDEATSRQFASWGRAETPDWNMGYCYQFWRGSHGSVRADGLLGQFCIVLPALDAFVVTTTGTLSTQRLLDHVWSLVVPALEARLPAEGPSPAFADVPAGAPGSPRAAELSRLTFRLNEQFVLPTRFYGGQALLTAIRIEAGNGALALVVDTEAGSYRLPIGLNAWAGGVSPVSTGYPEPYSGFARWESDDRLRVDLVFTEGGFRLALVAALDPAQLTVTLPANPGFEGRRVIGRPFP